MSRKQYFGGIGALVAAAVLAAVVLLSFDVVDQSQAQNEAGPVAGNDEIVFRCGYMARQRGTEDPDCADVQQPQAPTAVTATAAQPQAEAPAPR
jgi:hypothetical protein